MGEWFNVGKIVNTQGIKGEVRVISQTDFPEERYKPGSQLHLSFPDSPDKVEVTVKTHRKHKQFDLLSFEGHDNINDVERYKGGTLLVHENQLSPLEEGEFYLHEIIGCKVVTEEGEELGVVKEVLSPGANDVWVVKRPKEKDVLIPYIEDVVKHVDVKQQVITVNLMKGLL